MRKKVLLILLCIASVFAATGRDRLYIENFNIQAGKTVQVPVILLNDTVYSGLQTDLYLPAGLSLDMEDNEYIIDLTSRRIAPTELENLEGIRIKGLFDKSLHNLSKNFAVSSRNSSKSLARLSIDLF